MPSGVYVRINKVKKVQYTCVEKGCKNVSTWRYACEFAQPKENYRCHTCSMKKASNDVSLKEKRSENSKKMWLDPEYRYKMQVINSTTESKKAKRDRAIKQWSDPNFKTNFKNTMVITMNKPHIKEKIAFTTNTPESKKKRSNIMREVQNRPEVKSKKSEGLKKYINLHPERIKLFISYMQSENSKTNRAIQNRMNLVGDFWYGNVHYDDQLKKYCELWTENLKMRIRSFYGNVSVLSGKTKSDNGNRNMSCHHVYYQKKACCTWDKDTQGYYAMIDGERYYIKGDPNKFVTLTAGENTMVEKDKLKWVKIFEDIIENKYGGKCYYTKDEFLKINKIL